MKRILSILLTVVMMVGLMTVAAVTVSAAENITVYVKSPSGQSAELLLPTDTTIGAVKTQIAEKFSISFADTYRIYCSEVGYPNYKLEDEAKTLAEYNFQTGYTIHVEKDIWSATSDQPIKIFGLTIIGGTGAQEPYGSYGSADYEWNYYHKTITIKTGTPLIISGTAEEGTNIITRGSGWHYLTLDNVTMHESGGACITLNPSSWLNLTLVGTNQLTTSPKQEYGVVYKAPAISLNNTNTYLWINNASTGSLTATSNCEGMPGIGTCLETDQVYGIVMKGGTVTANGGKGAPGVRCNYLSVSGGTITANGGEDATTGILIYDTDKMTNWSSYEGLLGVTGDGKVVSSHAISAAYLVNKSTLTLSTYEALAGTKNYYHSSSTGKVYVGTVEYVFDDTQSKWVPVTYTITFDSNGGSAVEPITLVYGAVVTVPTDPTKAGYAFVGWTPAIPATMPAEDITLTAIWDVNTYALSWVVDGVTQTTNVAYGASITAPADPTKQNYTFAGWDAVIPATMPARDLTFTALWTAIPESIIAPTTGGEVTVSTRIPTQGESVTITPVPEQGMAIDSVTVTDANGAPVGVIDNGDGTYAYIQPEGVVTITVTFTAIPQTSATMPDYWMAVLLKKYNTAYPITAAAGEGGSITPAGVTGVLYKRSFTYTITPDEGYAIADVLVDGVSVGAVSNYTFKQVRAAHVIEVFFTPVDAPVDTPVDTPDGN